MTFDKAVYTVTFDECESNTSLYEPEVPDGETDNIAIRKQLIKEENSLIVTVHGDAYVIPLYEEKLKSRMPEGAEIECEVGIGKGDQSLLPTE